MFGLIESKNIYLENKFPEWCSLERCTLKKVGLRRTFGEGVGASLGQLNQDEPASG